MELDTYLRDEREVLAGVDTSEEGALRLARMYQKEHSQ